jgi:apolipoprotein D and lipocalin family protein
MNAKLIMVAGAVLALVAGAPAVAVAPQPAKPVPAALYSGRWYEIARTPNKFQTDCQGTTSDFSGWNGGDFSIVQTCRKGSVSGPKETFGAHGRILPASDNAKMELAYFGGLISREYWIVDRADDNAWAIMAMPTGRYVWLLSRQPVLDPGVRSSALGRMQALGFDMAHLEFPQQPPR